MNRRKNFKFVKGNICSSDLVNFVLEEEEIDTILHLAAQTHVDNSFGNSFSFTQNNILGTHVMLESAKVHGIKRFVHCSTDEVYGEGTADQEPMFEDNVLEVRSKTGTGREREGVRMGVLGVRLVCFWRNAAFAVASLLSVVCFVPCARPLSLLLTHFKHLPPSYFPTQPTNPYAATKAGAEFLAKSYHRSFNLPVIITRGNNVYGPHQFPEKLVPKFINLLARGRPLTLHGNGLNTRNFLYVTDVARAFDCVLHHGETGKIYNIGGTHERTNVDVSKDLIRKMGLLPSAAAPEKVAGGKSTAAVETDGGDDIEEMEPVHEKGEGLDLSVSSSSVVAAAAGELRKEDDDSAYAPFLTFVEDRPFNDLRYSINCEALRRLGWREEVSWEDGLAETIDWYRNKAQDRWGNIESALAPHPKGPLPDEGI